jgi:hypothetical protein
MQVLEAMTHASHPLSAVEAEDAHAALASWRETLPS